MSPVRNLAISIPPFIYLPIVKKSEPQMGGKSQKGGNEPEISAVNGCRWK